MYSSPPEEKTLEEKDIRKRTETNENPESRKEKNYFVGKYPMNIPPTFSEFSNAEMMEEKTEISTLHYPYCSVGVVRERIDEIYYYCTGTLIRHNMVLTAYTQIDPGSVEFGVFEGSQIKQFFKVTSIVSPSEDERKYGSFSLLVIEGKTQQLGYLGVDFREENINTGEKISLCGNLMNEDKMIIAEDSCESVSQFDISYQIQTFSGQSGSPIIKQDGMNFFVIGLHLKKKALGKKNKGVRMNTGMRLMIELCK